MAAQPELEARRPWSQKAENRKHFKKSTPFIIASSETKSVMFCNITISLFVSELKLNLIERNASTNKFEKHCSKSFFFGKTK